MGEGVEIGMCNFHIVSPSGMSEVLGHAGVKVQHMTGLPTEQAVSDGIVGLSSWIVAAH